MFTFLVGNITIVFITRQFLRYKAFISYTSLKQYLHQECEEKYFKKGLRMMLKVNTIESSSGSDNVKYSYKIQHPYVEFIQNSNNGETTSLLSKQQK